MTPKLKILLVDDDPSFALLVRSIIERMTDLGVEVALLILDDGPKAVDYVLGRGAYENRLEHPMPDLMLLDQRMKLMDGPDVLRAIKQEEAGRCLPTFVMSTSDYRKQQQMCYDLGATLYITKPMELERLTERLRLLVRFASEVLELPQAR